MIQDEIIAYQVLKEVKEGIDTMDSQTATNILNMLDNLKDKLRRRNIQLEDYKKNTLISRCTASKFDKILAEYCPEKELRKRWAKILIDRALRFYCNHHLDMGVAEEDLYQENGKYVNLEYSEKSETKREF